MAQHSVSHGSLKTFAVFHMAVVREKQDFDESKILSAQWHCFLPIRIRALIRGTSRSCCKIVSEHNPSASCLFSLERLSGEGNQVRRPSASSSNQPTFHALPSSFMELPSALYCNQPSLIRAVNLLVTCTAHTHVNYCRPLQILTDPLAQQLHGLALSPVLRSALPHILACHLHFTNI